MKRFLSRNKLEGVKWIWADNWYDGVVSGVCEYKNKRYYAVALDENFNRRYKWYRRYVLIDLPEEIWEEEIKRHEFFVEKVGNHFEFDIKTQKRKTQGLKPAVTWNEFYEKYPPASKGGLERNYDKKYPIIGWFDM